MQFSKTLLTACLLAGLPLAYAKRAYTPPPEERTLNNQKLYGSFTSLENACADLAERLAARTLSKGKPTKGDPDLKGSRTPETYDPKTLCSPTLSNAKLTTVKTAPKWEKPFKDAKAFLYATPPEASLFAGAAALSIQTDTGFYLASLTPISKGATGASLYEQEISITSMELTQAVYGGSKELVVRYTKTTKQANDAAKKEISTVVTDSIVICGAGGSGGFYCSDPVRIGEKQTNAKTGTETSWAFTYFFTKDSKLNLELLSTNGKEPGLTLDLPPSVKNQIGAYQISFP